EETNGQPGSYTGSYQSYFQDEPDVQEKPSSPVKKGNAQSSLSASSSPVAAGAAAESMKSTTLPEVTQSKSAGVTKNRKADNPEDVSLLRLRQEDPPVHWNSIGRNMEAGGLHGNIGTQIEIDDVRWSNNKKNSGKFKLATIQAFLRHDELPNWYFGFWNAR
ncbi:OmpG porin family protein, partial [Acinetobacter baumannii]